MDQVLLENELANDLRRREGEAELRDSSGKLVGYFIPESVCLNLEPPYSAEEMEEASKQQTGRPLEDIFRDPRAPS